MSLQFKTDFNGHPIHVLEVRGRTAFLAHEIGAAAGYLDGGRRFVELIVREWAPSLDEDDDVAQLTGAELAAIRREVPLPDGSTLALVLFTFGVERTLMRSDAKFAKPLLGFLRKEVLSRVLTLANEAPGAPAPSDDCDNGGAPPPPPPPLRLLILDRAALDRAADLRPLDLVVRKSRYDAIRRLGAKLHEGGFIADGTAADLEVEAVEVLLGRRLRTPLPRFGNDDDAPLAA